MDIDTTSINELPIMQNNPSNSNTEQIEQMQTTTQNIVIDKASIPDIKEPKQVRFDEGPIIQENTRETNIDNKRSNATGYELDIQTKICILSALIFFLLIDPKIKKYILNILVQVFGSFLKTEHGNMTQIGILVYSLFFFSTLMLITKSIDISSFHLAV